MASSFIDRAMLIKISREGGFAAIPGLSRESDLDTSVLTAAEARELEQLVTNADFFQLPATVGVAPAGAADYRVHTLTISNDEKSHTVRLVEPVEDSALQRLLDKVLQLTRHS